MADLDELKAKLLKGVQDLNELNDEHKAGTIDDAALDTKRKAILKKSFEPAFAGDDGSAMIFEDLDGKGNTVVHLNKDPVVADSLLRLYKDQVDYKPEKGKETEADAALQEALAAFPLQTNDDGQLAMGGFLNARNQAEVYNLISTRPDITAQLLQATDKDGNNVVHLSKDLDALDRAAKNQVPITLYAAKNNDDKTPIETAPVNTAEAMLRRLTNHKADLEKAGGSFDINELAEDGTTALGRAATPQHAVLFIKNGAKYEVGAEGGDTQMDILRERFKADPKGIKTIEDAAGIKSKPAAKFGAVEQGSGIEVAHVHDVESGVLSLPDLPAKVAAANKPKTFGGGVA